MRGGGRQTAYGPDQRFLFQFPCLLDRLALNELSERGAAGHGADTPFGKETDFFDAIAGEFERQLQNIATCWIFNLHGCIRIGNCSGITRMLEVIENLGRVHPEHLCDNCETSDQLDAIAFGCDCRSSRISVIRNKSVSRARRCKDAFRLSINWELMAGWAKTSSMATSELCASRASTAKNA